MPKASPRSRDSTQRQSHCVSDVFGGAVVSDILEAETALCRFAPLLGLRDGSQANAGVEDQTAKLKPCTPDRMHIQAQIVAPIAKRWLALKALQRIMPRLTPYGVRHSKGLLAYSPAC